MLIVTRKLNESVIINNNIKIVYLGTNVRGQAKLGIHAPDDVSIHREEIQDKINRGIPPKSKR